MAFTFGFCGDDFEEEGDDGTSALITEVERCTVTENEQLIPPKLHSLKDLLHDLPSQISYNQLSIASANGDITFSVPRRSVFDIRTQLMVEAVPEENDNDMLLAGLDRGDLTSGIYEGGFKTWECALDLAGLVADVEIVDGMHIIEIGAGSAIPSLTILGNKMADEGKGQSRSVHFTLCDYNEDVLRLATAPNIFLTQQVGFSDDSHAAIDRDMEVEDIDESKVSVSCQYWGRTNTTFNFISGAWGEDFVKLIHGISQSISTKPTTTTTLILASETIYSPTSIKVFTKTLMELLQQDPVNTKAWIAAKVIYFGVGGGVEDFMREVRQRNGCLRILLDVKGVGVSRVVLEVTANQTSVRQPEIV